MLERLLPFDVSSLWLALDIVLKATLVLAMAAVVTIMLRKSSAALRHRVWAMAFAVLLMLPLANTLLPGLSWRVVPPEWKVANAINSVRHAQPPVAGDINVHSRRIPAEASSAHAHPAAAPEGQPPIVPRTPKQGMVPNQPAVAAASSNPSPIAAAESPKAVDRSTWLLLVWLAGALAVMLPLVIGIIGNRRFKQRGRQLLDSDWQKLLEELSQRLRLRRKVLLLLGGPEQMPMTFGWLRPCVVLPCDSASWSPDRRTMVLVHELAHIRCADVLWQMVARSACAAFWLHPLAWWGLRRMRLEREHACDDCALLAGQKSSAYAAQLLEIARAHRLYSPLASAAALDGPPLATRRATLGRLGLAPFTGAADRDSKCGSRARGVFACRRSGHLASSTPSREFGARRRRSDVGFEGRDRGSCPPRFARRWIDCERHGALTKRQTRGRRLRRDRRHELQLCLSAVE